MRCAHCYQDEKTTSEMSPEEVEKTIEILSETICQWAGLYDISFLPAVNVTGGEPFLYPNLPRFLSSLRHNNFNVYLLTNGTLVGKEEAAMLAGIPVSGVQVSLEGPEKVHNAIRGKGSFSKTIRGVIRLLTQNLPVTLNLTLSEHNANYIEEMVSLGLSLGVQRIGFSRLVPSGRGLGLIDSLLSKERLREIYAKIHSLNTSGLDIVTGDPIFACSADGSPPENKSIPYGGCSAGISGLTILPDGTILPCRRLNIPLGNILQDNLRAIWATSPVLSALRNKDRYEGKCHHCSHWTQCRGCRAIAYRHSLLHGNSNYLSEDPQCFIGE